jgi:hypothetical protein
MRITLIGKVVTIANLFFAFLFLAFAILTNMTRLELKAELTAEQAQVGAASKLKSDRTERLDVLTKAVEHETKMREISDKDNVNETTRFEGNVTQLTDDLTREAKVVSERAEELRKAGEEQTRLRQIVEKKSAERKALLDETEKRIAHRVYTKDQLIQSLHDLEVAQSRLEGMKARSGTQ